jgi:hypothetical protein
MWNTLLHHRNVGGLDRGLRLALGAAFVGTGVVLASGTTALTLGIVVSLVGLGVLLSGLTARWGREGLPRHDLRVHRPSAEGRGGRVVVVQQNYAAASKPFAAR